jgi:hypothetical protein
VNAIQLADIIVQHYRQMKEIVTDCGFEELSIYIDLDVTDVSFEAFSYSPL